MGDELVKLLKLKERFAKQAVLCLDKQLITRSRFREVLGFQYIEEALEFYRLAKESDECLDNFQSTLWLRRAKAKK